MTRRWLLSAALIVGAISFSTPAQTVYNDDADGRRLAAVRFESVPDGSAARLRVVVSAVGPDVEPISGFEGVGGANRFTAEQFGNILAGSRRLSVRSRNVETGEIAVGEFRAGRTGFVPMRHLRADGSVDYLARWPRELPVELIIESGSLGAGRYETELRVDGIARARVTATVAPRGAVAMERFESLGAHGNGAQTGALASRRTPHFLQVLELQEEAPPPVKPVEVDPAEWAKRDMEGKWALYQRWIAPSPDLREGWVPFVVAEKDFAFLEWLALYQPDGFSSQRVGRALADANAPQWARAAHWMRNNGAGHGEEAGLAVLRSKPREALWWLRKHPSAGKDLAEFAAGLEKEKIEPIEAPHLLPPLDPQDVFGLLDAPATLSAFGERTTAEKGVVYEQQVVRAIRGYVTYGQPAPQWDQKLRALLRHASIPVRREAYLAFTHPVVGKLDPEPLVNVIDDPREAATIREAAALAFSYADHPMVYVKLHHIARDVEHPAWPAAVSRLGDLGDGFSLEALEKLKHPRASQDKILDDARERLRARVARENQYIGNDKSSVESLENRIWVRLAHAAWAEANGDPLAKELMDWTVTRTNQQVLNNQLVWRATAHIAGAPAPNRAVRTPEGGAWHAHAARIREMAAQFVSPAKAKT